jgi:dTDP-4-amino-4,6-dideoxygalactose transaminase
MYIISRCIYFHIIKNYIIKKGLCPIAEKLYQEILSLPIYYKLDNQIINFITELKSI